VIPSSTKKPGEFLEKQLWELAKYRLTNIVIPPFVARQPEGGLMRFPGTSNMGQLVLKAK